MTSVSKNYLWPDVMNENKIHFKVIIHQNHCTWYVPTEKDPKTTSDYVFVYL